MEQLKKGRRILRATFTKTLNELERQLASTEPDECNVKMCLETLKEKFKSLHEVDEKIYEALWEEDASEEDLINEMNARDEYGNKFKLTKLRAEELLNDKVLEECRSTASQGNSSAISITGRRKFKLPAIELKKYDGDIRGWLSFLGAI